MEGCYSTRISLQVFFTDFDGSFKSTNKTLAVYLLKENNILRLLLETKFSYFQRCDLMKYCMAKRSEWLNAIIFTVFS